MYAIICKYHILNINNGNKVPVFPGYICNRLQNMFNIVIESVRYIDLNHRKCSMVHSFRALYSDFNLALLKRVANYRATRCDIVK